MTAGCILTWQKSSLPHQFSDHNDKEVKLNEEGREISIGIESHSISSGSKRLSKKISNSFDDQKCHNHTFKPIFLEECKGGSRRLF